MSLITCRLRKRSRRWQSWFGNQFVGTEHSGPHSIFTFPLFSELKLTKPATHNFLPIRFLPFYSLSGATATSYAGIIRRSWEPVPISFQVTTFHVSPACAVWWVENLVAIWGVFGCLLFFSLCLYCAESALCLSWLDVLVVG